MNNMLILRIFSSDNILRRRELHEPQPQGHQSSKVSFNVSDICPGQKLNYTALIYCSLETEKELRIIKRGHCSLIALIIGTMILT